MLTFSTQNTLSLEPKSPLGVFACFTIYFLLTSPLLRMNARTKQYLLCKTKPISGGLLMSVTSAITSTYEQKSPLRAPKKQSQFKTNWQKGRDRQTSPNTSYQFRATLLRAYKAPLAGVPPLQAPRAHKTIPFMQNKANLRRADNDRNLSYNKHLRTKISPSSTKKTKPIKPNFKPANANVPGSPLA